MELALQGTASLAPELEDNYQELPGPLPDAGPAVRVGKGWEPSLATQPRLGA